MTTQTDIRTTTTSFEGASVTYHEAGSCSGDSMPLVLVHGTGGDTATHFAHLFPMMATRTRVVAIDLAPVPDGIDLTVDALVEQVRVVVDEAIGPQAPFQLLGYSFGAVVSAAVAAQLGTRVVNLILVAGWVQTDLQQQLRNQVWEALDAAVPDVLGSFVAFCGVSGHFLNQFTEAVLASAPEQRPVDDFTRQQMRLNRTIDLTNRLDAITARTLVVSLTDDVMVPSHHQLQLFGAIADARLTNIASGHAVFVERPAELMRATDLFLRDPARHPAGTIIPAAHS